MARALTSRILSADSAAGQGGRGVGSRPSADAAPEKGRCIATLTWQRLSDSQVNLMAHVVRIGIDFAQIRAAHGVNPSFRD